MTLFHVWGIPLRVHASWLVIFALIAWSLSVGYFPQVVPEAPVAAHWVGGAVAALLLFVSVFLHELSHALVARRAGLRVSAITLHVFGGVSQLEDEPGSPEVEFRIAIVGPLTSFLVAGGAYLVTPLAGGHPLATAILRYLALVNLVVGAFNLVPGFPLDGGRVLRAALWKIRGNLQSATETASRAGSAVAFGLMALGVVRGMAGEFLGGLWFVLIGLFLRQAASGSYEQLVLRRALAPLAVREVMTGKVFSVGADLTLDRVADDFFWPHHVSSFPVIESQRVLGIVSVHQLGEIPRDRWPHTPVRQVMRPLDDSLAVGPDDTLWSAFEKLSRNGLGRLAVVEGSTLVGYLSLKDVLHVLGLRRASGGEGTSRTS